MNPTTSRVETGSCCSAGRSLPVFLLLQQGNGPDSSGNVVDNSNLTTVYDQLQAHRIVETDAAVSV